MKKIALLVFALIAGSPLLAATLTFEDPFQATGWKSQPAMPVYGCVLCLDPNKAPACGGYTCVDVDISDGCAKPIPAVCDPYWPSDSEWADGWHWRSPRLPILNSWPYRIQLPVPPYQMSTLLYECNVPPGGMQSNPECPHNGLYPEPGTGTLRDWCSILRSLNNPPPPADYIYFNGTCGNP